VVGALSAGIPGRVAETTKSRSLDYSPPLIVIPRKAAVLAAVTRDLCIFLCQHSVICKMHRSFTSRPPRPAKNAGRKKAAGAAFRMTDKG
jgi:hypothetical protein